MFSLNCVSLFYDFRQIPKQGNIAEIILTVLHRNFIAVDEFLGVVNIPLAGFDVYERPRNR
jgi:Rab11 family-interacting protein 1/2/5